MLTHQYLGKWPMIPEQAFLFFPAGNQIKQGQAQKQWRKIFQDESPYDEFENKSIDTLQKKLKELKITPHIWFDKANKLRFLQANKFKIQETCKSIKQASQWRQTYFPLKQNPKVESKLNEGTMYFCGRDKQYRPILVAEVVRMKDYSQEVIHGVLNTMLEYAVDNLLVPGQVQNYVLIINLDDAGLSDRGSVSKIVSFTSNTYRSRLYASYLLNTPYLIASGWNAFASSIVSENTLRKIKISRQMFHQDMWTHIDKQIVEEKYGGKLPNLKGPFWPPNQKYMNYSSQSAAPQHHISKQQYNGMFKSGKLKNRKVKAELIDKQPEATPRKTKDDHNSRGDRLQSQKYKDVVSTARIEHSPSTNRKMISHQSLLPPEKIKNEVMVSIRKRDFKLFFQDEKFMYLFQNLK